ncbi:potassium channel family protein [Symmachiella macrocystis]|uniref:potassium channel family protein n=1 Tax=Symmachiella macrocystis TaxID=2527985 RepID=UPI001E3B7A8A|nr:potassium channel family protein [Symmachiella macrocystis]
MILFALMTPFVKHSSFEGVLFYGLLTLSLAAAVLAVSDQRSLAYVASALLGIAFMSITWATFIESSLISNVAANTIADGAAFIAFAFTATLILKTVVKPGPVTTEKIFAAVCVYLVSGIAWGLLYVLVYLNDPSSFMFSYGEPWRENAPNETSSVFSVFCYFSFVTMTTLGYGDISPTSDISRTLAWLQAVLGQLYIAILIARLVGMHAQTEHEQLQIDQPTKK